jgi:hypothetical protein
MDYQQNRTVPARHIGDLQNLGIMINLYRAAVLCNVPIAFRAYKLQKLR